MFATHPYRLQEQFKYFKYDREIYPDSARSSKIAFTALSIKDILPFCHFCTCVKIDLGKTRTSRAELG